MLTPVRFRSWILPLLATVGLAGVFPVVSPAQRGRTGDEADTQEGVEVQTRGPVHEAFAGVVSFRPEAGIVVQKAPPEPIEELPPDQKPAGENVAWIPGYWAWDDDRDDFLWVSGVWRALPPGRQWVPGYWQQASDGYQWISGYWADAQAKQVEYLPEPPQTIDEGPSADATSPDQVWIPGTWVWYHGRFAWRPGYWSAGHANWVWVPASYVWSPRGYVFVDGYWDYAIGRRGLAFAPVYIDAGLYGQSGFAYSPAFAINLAVFGNSLFLRPAYGHYYFGDYYAGNYANAGFYPWFAYNTQFRNGYDPIFASQRWQNRQDQGWEHKLQAQFEKRRDNEDARPPRTLTDQAKSAGSDAKSAAGGPVVATLAGLSKGGGKDLHLQAVDKQERQELSQSAKKIRDFGGERQKLEAGKGKAAKGASRESEPVREKLAQSPITAKGTGHFGKEEAPPEPHQVPKPDPSAEHPSKAAGGKAPARDLPPGKGVGNDVPEKRNPPGANKGDSGREPPKREPPKTDGEPKPKKVEPRPQPPKPETPKVEPKPKKVEPPAAPPKGPPGKPAPEPKPGPKPEPKPKNVEPPAGPPGTPPKPEPKPKKP